MTGLRTLLGSTMGRVAVGLVTAAAVAFLAPPLASADPIGDADAAMTQAWEAGGGATGSLGIKDGGAYPAGAGFGQNFAGGKIFFTPQTGAHIMAGAILDKYLSLGGPADGDLGFPNIDEGAGKAPNSRNTTFSAADNPVIFWTPDTGAHVVRGALNAAWDRLGGSAGVLGVPTEDEVYRGDLVNQTFTGGQLSWNRKTNSFTSTPPELAEQLAGLEVPGDVTSAINTARRVAGGPMGPLGAADGGQYQIGTDGTGQNYAGGKIFYSPATGANVVTGQVLAKYESVGGPQGDMGFPTSSVGDGGLAPQSSIVTFAAPDQPVIFWTPDFGADIVRGAMNAAWAKLGGATGELGAPTADQTESGEEITQKFNGGAITWNKVTNEFSTEPAKLASQLAGLEIPGLKALQAPPPGEVSTTAKGDKWYTWHRWWLLAIVPIAVLLVAVVIGVLLNRRRHDDRPLDGFDDGYVGHDDDDDDDDDGFGHEPDAGGRREPESGPMPVITIGPPVQYSPVSMWAMPDTGTPESEVPAEAPAPAPPAEVEADFQEDPDSVDTAPTQIPSEPEPDHDEEDEPDAGPASGRHSAIIIEEPAPAETSLRLATEDPFHAPDGYPIKADTKSGLYWLPGTGRYDHARAEIWFASEEFALTNGFVRG
ncbi:MAG: hypothetical protein QOJ28_608 [Mycobacterium sp.]|jgi:uncharacterized protein with LGFP repeats|nr:hypothetical protein [Mycobacterium sp.]MDT5247974.1 hypothetical protein [Mycobacterium sp.]